ncbi:MAG: hypothetical protein ACRBCI_02150 [Cellvibrionaceae bacterium]
MNENNHIKKDDENDFFDRPSTIKWILRIFYSSCVLLVLVDFLVHRHIETSIEKIPAFYAIYGFVACVVLVLIATQMRKWLMRDEHYYSESSHADD